MAHFAKVIFANGSLHSEGADRFVFPHSFNVGADAGWRLVENRFEVLTDKYGFCPIYYRAGENWVAVSTSIDDLLTLNPPVSIDWDALSVFFSLGWFLEEKTPFTEILVLPPNSKLTLGSDGIEVTSSTIIPKDIIRPSLVSASNKLYELFSSSMDLCGAASPFALPLSGGVDSRLLLCELLKRKAPIAETITVGQETCADDSDPVFAKKVSQIAGLKNQRINTPRSKAFTSRVRKTKLTNYASLEHEWAIPILEHVQNRYKIIYDGIGIDIFLDKPNFEVPIWTSLVKKRKFPEAAQEIANYFSIRQGFSDNIAKKINGYNRDNVITQLANTLEKYSVFPNPLESFLFLSRTRRCISMIPMGIYGAIENVHCPFLDPNIIDYVMSIDLGVEAKYDLRKEVLRSQFPDFAKICYAENKKTAVAAKSSIRHLEIIYDTNRALAYMLRHTPDLALPYFRSVVKKNHIDARNICHLAFIKSTLS